MSASDGFGDHGREEPPPLDSFSEEEDSEEFRVAAGLKLDLSAEPSPMSTPRKAPTSYTTAADKKTTVNNNVLHLTADVDEEILSSSVSVPTTESFLESSPHPKRSEVADPPPVGGADTSVSNYCDNGLKDNLSGGEAARSAASEQLPASSQVGRNSEEGGSGEEAWEFSAHFANNGVSQSVPEVANGHDSLERKEGVCDESNVVCGNSDSAVMVDSHVAPIENVPNNAHKTSSNFDNTGDEEEDDFQDFSASSVASGNFVGDEDPHSDFSEFKNSQADLGSEKEGAQHGQLANSNINELSEDCEVQSGGMGSEPESRSDKQPEEKESNFSENVPEEDDFEDDFGDFAGGPTPAPTTAAKSSSEEDFANFADFEAAPEDCATAPRKLSPADHSALEWKFQGMIKALFPSSQSERAQGSGGGCAERAHSPSPLHRLLREGGDACWAHVADFEASRALGFRWLNCAFQHHLHKSLNIDTSTIVYTEKWGAIEVPKFAASVVGSPMLQPQQAPSAQPKSESEEEQSGQALQEGVDDADSNSPNLTMSSQSAIAKEAQRLLDKIPDISFMLSKELAQRTNFKSISSPTATAHL